MIQFKDYLLNVNGYVACKPARQWNGDRTAAECWRDCERADWMMWLLHNSEQYDRRVITKIKALCVDLVKHLITDYRAIDALKAAHDFGDGIIDSEHLCKVSRIAREAGAEEQLANKAAMYAATLYIYSATITDVIDTAGVLEGAPVQETMKKCADIVRIVVPELEIPYVT